MKALWETMRFLSKTFLRIVNSTYISWGFFIVAATACAGLPQGDLVLGESGMAGMVLIGNTSLVQVSQDGNTMKFVTEKPGINHYEAQFHGPTQIRVEKGDVLWVRFLLRCLRSRQESGEGQTEVVFELGKAPWTKSMSYQARAGQEWKTFQIPFVSKGSYGPGEAALKFRLAYAHQTIEIKDIALWKYGKKIKIKDLPRTLQTYQGQEKDAPWRKLAQARINKIRKGDLMVEIRNSDGSPVAGARVKVQMKRHAFAFGSALSVRMLMPAQESDDTEMYKSSVTKYFNTASIENGLKWPAWKGDLSPWISRQQTEESLKWLRDKKLRVRGHCLVWPSWFNTPKSLKKKKDDPKALAQAVLDRIRETAGATQGLVYQWDVINEPFTNHDLMDILGPEAMVDWFHEARAADPKSKLYINDYAILSGGGGQSAHRDHYEKTIAFLLKNNAPLDGIGLQSHFGSTVTAPEDLLKILNRYAEFQKPLMITEYDLVSDDEAFEADYLRDFMTLIFSHPLVKGFQMWGFWDGYHWKNDAPLFRKDWTLKPSGQAWLDLVFRDWWTQETLTTNEQGQAKIRGFLGDYEITARFKKEKKTSLVHLEMKGTNVVMILQ